ncbi:MAG: hydrolase, partial [Clostridia bacterium]|nr:hydrolase [Clostridia bacterium]
MLNIEDVKNEFKNIFNLYVKRRGADKLLEYLENNDFFTAPASARFHLAEEGGLCQHSINVYK